MGQKVNPHGLRVGVIKDWDSRWYASEEKVGDLIVEDQKIRKYLKKTLYGAGVPKIEIERSRDVVTIFLHCARPGMVIGTGGEQIEQYRLAVEKLIGKKVKLNIVEVRNPDMNADWDSRWYASDEKVGDLIVEDQKIRKYLKKTLYGAGVPKIEIERSNEVVTIFLHCARPGMVIGKGGEQIEQYRLAVEKLIGKKVRLNIVEVRNPDMNAQLVAENIAQQLEKRISHRRAMKNAMARAMRAGAKGIKVCCSGRLGGREIAGVEHYHEGTIPLQTIRADIEYGFAEAATTFGRIGVKVWIYKGEVLSQTLRTTPRTMDTSKPYQERRERRPRRDGDRRGGFGDRRQGGGFNPSPCRPSAPTSSTASRRLPPPLAASA